MPPRMLVSMQGIADLAHVRRPVVSTWRRRFREGLDAFPEPILGDHPGLMFDASEVAQWLEATGHGNNVDASADAAAVATPAGLMFSDPAHVEELEALVVLQAHLGPLRGRSGSALVAAATQVDAEDRSIRREVESLVASEHDWADFADRVVDAAYSPAGALDVIARRSSAAAPASGPVAPLSREAADLLAALVSALPSHTAGHRRRDQRTARRPSLLGLRRRPDNPSWVRHPHPSSPATDDGTRSVGLGQRPSGRDHAHRPAPPPTE